MKWVHVHIEIRLSELLDMEKHCYKTRAQWISATIINMQSMYKQTLDIVISFVCMSVYCVKDKGSILSFCFATYYHMVFSLALSDECWWNLKS